MNYCNNELDIAYYEFLLDQVQEEQKIHEMLTISKYSHVLEGFDDEQVAIYEANIITAIIEFIKKIVDKIRQFFSKALGVVKNIKNNATDKKLYDAVAEKIKNISKEDSKKFSVQINHNIAEIEDNIKDTGDKIKESKKLFDDAQSLFALVLPAKVDLDRNEYQYFKFKNENERFDSLKARLHKLNSKLEEEKVKQPGVEFIDFAAITSILEECKQMDSEINKVEADLKQSDKDIVFYKNWSDKAIKMKINAEAANQCKTILAGISTYTMKVYKMHIDLYLLRNSLYKGALHKFVAFKPQSASNESVEFFDRLLESMMYNETEDGGVELCMS